MDHKTITVIGLGSIGKRHIKNVKKLFPTCRLIGVSSSGRTLTSNVELDLTLNSIKELRNYEVNEAIVASPASFHYQHVNELQKQKVNKIFVEKPIGSSLKCINLFENFAPPHLYIGYCLRYLPSLIKLKSIISKLALQDILHIYVRCGEHLSGWRSDKNYKGSVSANAHLGGGVLLELSHELDYLQWIFGDLTVEASRVVNTGQLEIDVEDLAQAYLISEGGVRISLHLDFLSPVAERTIELVHKEKIIKWIYGTGEIIEISNSGELELFVDKENAKDEMYISMLKEFFAGTKSDSMVGKFSALQTLKLVQEIKQHAQ